MSAAPERGALLASEAAEAYGVPLAVVLGRRRSKSVGVARAAVAAALREEGWTLVRIARYLRRDHSTICYLLQAHAWRKQTGASVPFKAWKVKGGGT